MCVWYVNIVLKSDLHQEKLLYALRVVQVDSSDYRRCFLNGVQFDSTFQNLAKDKYNLPQMGGDLFATARLRQGTWTSAFYRIIKLLRNDVNFIEDDIIVGDNEKKV